MKTNTKVWTMCKYCRCAFKPEHKDQICCDNTCVVLYKKEQHRKAYELDRASKLVVEYENDERCDICGKTSKVWYEYETDRLCRNCANKELNKII